MNKKYDVNEIVENIEDGKWYSSWKDVCNNIGIDYSTYKDTTSKRLLLDNISMYYNIEQRDGSWKIRFNKLSDSEIDIALHNKKIKNILNGNNTELSKFFQSSLIKYLNDKIGSDGNNYVILSIGQMLKIFDMVQHTHNHINDEYHNAIYGEEYVNKYVEITLKNSNEIFKYGLKTLQKKNVIKYNDGFNITYKIVSLSNKVVKNKYKNNPDLLDKHLKYQKVHWKSELDIYDYNYIEHEEYQHVYARKELANAVYNGRNIAWELICELFDFDYDEADIKDLNINIGSLMSMKNTNYVKNKKKANLYKYKEMLPKKEFDLLVQFFNDYNMSLYLLFKKLSRIKIAKLIELYVCPDKIYGDRHVIVEYYYKAYEIFMNKIAIDLYSNGVIESILTKNSYHKGKELKIDFMAQHMYNKVDRKTIEEDMEENGNEITGVDDETKNALIEKGVIDDILNLCSYMIYPRKYKEDAIKRVKSDLFDEQIKDINEKLI